ncbi:MAG: hypothetical protein FWC53_00065 [Firmicutes bacterium]|nr:hypothetical protein [Bacillota bacterium]
MDITFLLIISVGILIMLIIVLGLIYLKMYIDERNKNGKPEEGKNGKPAGKSSAKSAGNYTQQSIFNFMEFDTIEDNMIVQKDGKRFLMVVECQGVNYDLMSEMEKTAVESGFQQFLNTLRHQVQLYVQTRTINLEESLQTYKKKLDEIKIELDNEEMKYNQMAYSSDYSQEEKDKQNMVLLRNRNLYEYGKDIIYYTEKMSLNRSVLRKQYYVIIPYYSSETGSDLLDKSEIQNIAFSELYTRAQSIIRTLTSCSILGKVLDSYELADLLYSSYNRDESETYGLEKALRAGYDELYSTSQDVIEKRMKALDGEVEKRAYELAENAVSEANAERLRKLAKKEKSIDELINDMAQVIVNENEQYLGPEMTAAAIKKVQSKRSTKEKGGEGNVKEKQKSQARMAG